MQVAGDKLPFKDQVERLDNLTATTYLGAGPWVWDQAEPVQGRADERNERVDAVTRGLLGLTVACARCHNHKYDPIPQRDYYGVVGIFANSTYAEYPVVSKVGCGSLWTRRISRPPNCGRTSSGTTRLRLAQTAPACRGALHPDLGLHDRSMERPWQTEEDGRMRILGEQTSLLIPRFFKGGSNTFPKTISIPISTTGKR